jgi:hypothetical protein
MEDLGVRQDERHRNASNDKHRCKEMPKVQCTRRVVGREVVDAATPAEDGIWRWGQYEDSGWTGTKVSSKGLAVTSTQDIPTSNGVQLL